MTRQPQDFIAHAMQHIPRSGIREFFDVVAGRPDVISMSIGEPDFMAPARARQAGIAALERGETGYTSNMGHLPLRQELARYMEKIFGVRYDSETEILITVGVSEALDLVMRAMLNPGDEVLIHQPSFVSYDPLIRFAGGTPVVVETTPENFFRVTRNDLEKRVTPKTKMLVLNYPNNPTGAVLDRATITDLADFAREHHIVVVEDAVYAELGFDEDPGYVASQPGMKEQAVLLHGFSKTWAMTGFRIGFACAPAPLVDAMMKIHQYTMLSAPTIGQITALEAVRSSDEEVAVMRDAYRERAAYVHRTFNEMGLPCTPPGGAFYAFPCIRSTGLSSKEFAYGLLEDENVAIVPGTAFGACGEGFVRCSYATDMEKIKEAMARMKRWVGQRRTTTARA